MNYDYVPYQLCPKCKGREMIGESRVDCNVCKGDGILLMHVVDSAKIIIPADKSQVGTIIKPDIKFAPESDESVFFDEKVKALIEKKLVMVNEKSSVTAIDRAQKMSYIEALRWVLTQIENDN